MNLRRQQDLVSGCGSGGRSEMIGGSGEMDGGWMSGSFTFVQSTVHLHKPPFTTPPTSVQGAGATKGEKYYYNYWANLKADDCDEPVSGETFPRGRGSVGFTR